MSIIVRPAFEAYAKSIDREWSNDRAQTVGASEVGKCARSIYWAKNEGDEFFGAHRDEDYEDTFGHKVRGKVFEDAFFVPAMQAAFGERLLFSGEQQRTFRKGFLTATPDGYLHVLTDDEMTGLSIPSDYRHGLTIDCKSVDPRVTELPKPEHVFQVQVQIGLLNENGFPCEYGLISYTDSSDWSNVKEFLVVGDPAIYEVAKARAQKIMTAESASELDPEGIFAGGKECKFCPFTKACAELRCSRVPERGYEDKPLAPTQAALLESHVLSYHDACDAIAVWEKVVNDEKEAVRNILEGAGVRNYKGNGVSVSWSKVAGRKTWDNDAVRSKLAELLIETQSNLSLDDFKRVGDPSDRLTISVKDK